MLSAYFPVLDTPRMELKAIGHEHHADLFRLLTDPRVTAFFPVLAFQQASDTAKIVDRFAQLWQEQSGVRWGMFLTGSTELIGMAGFNSFSKGHKGAIVYLLLPEYQGRGLAMEAIREVLRYGFSELELRRIEAEVLPGNKPSERVLDKLGFRHEGLLRQWLAWNGGFHDINMYSLLKEELV